MVDILVILFAVLVSVGIVILVLEPVWRTSVLAGDEATENDPADVLEDLYARRDTLYASIRELDFDHSVGKVSDEDYERLRDRLKREAADVLRQIEEVKAAQATIREHLEMRVRALATATANPGTPPPPEPSASPERAPLPEEPRFCTQCGAPLVPGARFCSQCGAAVRRTETAP